MLFQDWSYLGLRGLSFLNGEIIGFVCYFENVLKFTLILAAITECPAGLSHLFSCGAFALTPLRGRSPAGLHIIIWNV